jgi:UrcA family protein
MLRPSKQRMFEMATPKLISLSVLAASALAISTPTFATAKTKVVKFEDIDLASAQGQELLKARIKQAVKHVCASPRAITPADIMDRSMCEQRALASAMPKARQKIAAYLETRRFASSETQPIVGN